jgi:hypothetical protein
MRVWPRPEQPVAQGREHKPVAEQERERWLEGYHCAWAVKQAWPTTVGVNRAGREGASPAWFGDARRREPGPRAAGVSRATAHRRPAPGATPRSWWAERPPTGSVGPRTRDLTRQPARPPRPVPLAVVATPVTGQGARRPGGKLPPVPGSAVYAQDSSPPQGEAPSAWPLLPSGPVTDGPRAGPVGQG